MNMKKITLFLAPLLSSITAVNATTPGEAVTLVFQTIGIVFEQVGTQLGRSTVLEGLVLIFSLIALYKFYDNLLKLTPLVDSGGSTRAISIGIAFITLGGLFIAAGSTAASFMAVYGRAFLAILTLTVAVGLLYSYFKDNEMENKYLKYGLGIFLTIIAYSFSMVIINYIYAGVPNAAIVSYLNDWTTAAMVLAILGFLGGLIWAVLSGDDEPSDSTRESGADRKTRLREEKVAKRKVDRANTGDKADRSQIIRQLNSFVSQKKNIDKKINELTSLSRRFRRTSGEAAYTQMRQLTESILVSLKVFGQTITDLATLHGNFEEGTEDIKSRKKRSQLNAFVRNTYSLSSGVREMVTKCEEIIKNSQTSRVGTSSDKDPSSGMKLLKPVQDLISIWTSLKAGTAQEVKAFSGITGAVVESQDVGTHAEQAKHYASLIPNTDIQTDFTTKFTAQLSADVKTTKLKNISPSVDGVSYYAVALKNFLETARGKGMQFRTNPEIGRAHV